VEAETYTECEAIVTEDVVAYLHDFEVSSINHQRIEEVLLDEYGDYFEIKWEFWQTDEKSTKKVWYITAENFLSAYTQMAKMLPEGVKSKIVKIEEKQIKDFLKKSEE
jgi:hypothetical protein